MHLDGFFVNALTAELNKAVAGSRVEDVYTQDNNLVIQLRAPGRTLRLAISVHTHPYGLYLTRERGDKTATAFDQTVKKHLRGLFCTALDNPPFERKTTLAFAPAPSGSADFFLHVEIMGRNNDIILCRGDTILVSTRPPHREGTRNLQPGDRYAPPPPPGKMPPQNLTPEVLKMLLHNAGSSAPDAVLVRSLLGMSPHLAREICWRCNIAEKNVQALCDADIHLMHREIQTLAQASLQGKTKPSLYPQGPYWTELLSLGTAPRPGASLSAILESWSTRLRTSQSFDAGKKQLLAAIRARIIKLDRTIAKQQAEKQRALQAEYFRQIADTLLAATHNIPRGAAEAVLTNVHTGEPVRIDLDPGKTASGNASHYYKLYNKYKTALAQVNAQIHKNREQLAYMATLEYAAEAAETPAELQEIRAEMEEQGLLRRGSARSRTPGDEQAFLSYLSPHGHKVLVGKNNRQNEILTLKKADKSHYWLHARHSPGSHVILCTDAPGDADLEFAAAVAAWHSKARNSPKVEVVWTQVKNVKKIPGARPGMVQYSQYKSAFIEPRLPSTGAESPEIPGTVRR